MNALTPLETRSALPLEIRSDDNTDPLATATAAVEELRSASEQFRTQQQTELRGVTDRLAALETRLNRPGTQQQENHDETPAEVRAFNSYVRSGEERMEAEEIRAMTVSTDAAGGYLAPEQFVRELDRNLVLFSPIRTVARITQASAGELILPKRTGTMTASWGEETEASNGTQPTYGQQKINVYELKCHVDISLRLQGVGQAATQVVPNLGGLGQGLSSLMQPLAQAPGATGAFSQALMQMIQQMTAQKGIGLLGGVLGFADGGHVSGPGTSTSDSIPAMLSDGEFVVNARSTRKHRAALEAINAGKAPMLASCPATPSATSIRPA